MINVLTNDQIDLILRSHIIGRIACNSKVRLYIVPLAFVFDGKDIYAHAKEGLKISMMRSNPNVCFQVDDIENMGNWRSVIVWGKYEELKTKSLQAKAFKLLNDRFTPLRTSESVKPSYGIAKGPESVEKKLKAVFFRILIKEKSGRYEKSKS